MSQKQDPSSNGPGPVVALCGGVGAARFLRGLVRAVPPEEVIAIVNTGDDREFYGVHVAPDLDIVSYTLAELIDQAVGYGLAGDTFHLVDSLAKLGHETWFRLGDQDFAYCLHRTQRLRAGRRLAEVTDELRRHHGLRLRILPMAEDPCPTQVTLRDGRCMHFEDYMIREGAPDTVSEVDLSAAAQAQPTPGVLEAIQSARAILLCPSNPVVSIGPILAMPGIREALAARRCPSVAISPIVGGAPIKGPARQLLNGMGIEVSAQGVANHYRHHRPHPGTVSASEARDPLALIDAYVIDDRDREQAPAIEALGLSVAVTDSIMVDAEASERLARVALEVIARDPA